MPVTITLKNIPDDLYDRIKEGAQLHHRSINGEVIARLEQSLLPSSRTAGDRVAEARRLRTGLGDATFDAGTIADAKRRGRP
jgi:plasmid stability protein